jgi:hypothetical protein
MYGVFYCEHVKVIRCNIKTRSVKKCRQKTQLPKYSKHDLFLWSMNASFSMYYLLMILLYIFERIAIMFYCIHKL